jgi:hypothetical protein
MYSRIEVPKSWDDCVRLDKENDITLWQDAVRKEMKNFRIAFKILNGDESVPPPYQDGIFPPQGEICRRWTHN